MTASSRNARPANGGRKMASKKSTGWGCKRINYSKKDVLEIVELLRLNNWNEAAVFGVVWNGCFKDHPRENAEDVLRLVHRVNSFIACYCANGEIVWKTMVGKDVMGNDVVRFRKKQPL
jgi:hypothetical protein